MAYKLDYDGSAGKKSRPILTASTALLAAISIPLIVLIIILAFPTWFSLALLITFIAHPSTIATIFITLAGTTLTMVALYYALKKRRTKGIASWLLAAFFPILMTYMFLSILLAYLLFGL